MAQTQTLVIARLLGLEATIEKHSPLVRKRRNDPVQNVPGDGRNISQDVHDPVQIVEAITLELNLEANAVFLKAAHKMFDQQLLDPTTAQPINLYSYLDGSGNIVDEESAIQAVIQSVSGPDGDTNSHALATSKIVVKPLAMRGVE
jgi:hypothetical protein